MTWQNKVIWSEGMFLQPQHFQQQDRYVGRQLEGRLSSTVPWPWGFFALQVGVTLGIGVLFIGMTRLLKSIPLSLINLPNKGYWLAPQRREETLDRLASYFDVFASATVLLLVVVFELTSLASRGGGLATNLFLPALVSYLVFSAGWTVALIRTFASVTPAG